MGELKSTNLALKLVVRSFKYLVCVLEDVLMKVRYSFISMDLMDMEMDEDS
jgi:hypothetical protein